MVSNKSLHFFVSRSMRFNYTFLTLLIYVVIPYVIRTSTFQSNIYNPISTFIIYHSTLENSFLKNPFSKYLVHAKIQKSQKIKTKSTSFIFTYIMMIIFSIVIANLKLRGCVNMFRIN